MNNAITITEAIHRRQILKAKYDATAIAIDALDSMCLKHGVNESSQKLMSTWLDEASELYELIKHLNGYIFKIRSEMYIARQAALALQR